MKNEMLIPRGTPLKSLVLIAERIEKALQKELHSYNPTVCWQLLDDELTMQVLLRLHNSGVLFGKAFFSSDVLEEGEEEYRLSFGSSLPDEPYRYSEDRLEEWSKIEKKVADIVLMEIKSETKQ